MREKKPGMQQNTASTSNESQENNETTIIMRCVSFSCMLYYLYRVVQDASAENVYSLGLEDFE